MCIELHKMNIKYYIRSYIYKKFIHISFFFICITVPDKQNVELTKVKVNQFRFETYDENIVHYV